MDSTEGGRIRRSSSLSSNQESSIFNDISNMSPVKPCKPQDVGQPILELSPPSLQRVFGSPRKPQRETSFARRRRRPGSSDAEPCLKENTRRKILSGQGVSRPHVTRSEIQSIPPCTKVCDTKGSVQVQPSRPLECVDEFMANPLKRGVNSSGSPNLCSNQAIDLKEATAKVLVDDDVQKDIETQAGDDPESKKSCPLVKPILSSSRFHHHGMQDKLQAEESVQQGISDHTPHLLPQSLHNAQITDIHNENDRIIYNRSIENQMRYDGKEANQHQRDMHRRRLQFEGAEARTKITGSVSCSWNPPNNGLSARPLASPVGSNTSNACTAEPNAASRHKQVTNFPQHALPGLPIGASRILESHINKVDRSARNSRSSPKTVPMPSCIGLHLNSIGNAVTLNRGLNVKLAGKEHLSVQREKSLSGSDSHLLEDSRGQLVPLGVFGNSSAKLTSKSDSPLAYSACPNTELGQQECQASVMANSCGSFQTSQKMKPWDNSLLIDQHVVPCENKRATSQDASSFEEFNQVSPGKKRKEEPHPTEKDECKRCNCKKSKCLKLYCDCFAAGVYCAVSCSCQECFNKTEYDDTITGTRQQIESRNPLAFGPKIVRRESPQNGGEDGNQTTPASARHKRGCNCKKSMCLKKYCECYQAGVGCSDGCRCEGCKNVFGKKEGRGEILEVEHRKVADERWREPHRLFDGKMGMQENRCYISPPVQCHSDVMPPISLFQHLNQAWDTPQSYYPPRRHPESSPKSEIPVSSPGNFSNDKLLKTIEGNAAVVPYCPRPDYLQSEMVYPFSPRWDALTYISNITPLAQDPKSSQTQLCHGNVHLSASRPSSHSWGGSPVTPNPHFGGTKFITDPSSDSRLYNIREDEAPNIVKETHSPLKTVKSSSPNQERVSPRKNSLGVLRKLTSSPGLSSSHKTILQSMSSFPRTPDSEPEGSNKRAADS